ncbi:ABC transporter substrate-binding protein [Mesorhizobium sp. INR15]|uniref:ABC transporter substrate-binding protein n=1 Tax=Mesorhizobium sp. INR15 TaxID=2654248 RepID=UPI00189661B6|nr:extracellular solute-binding protein [Mesorhizobium sp. INR15]QPC95519.1 extracellular solute-binding protein [Mesorhizobium sp. INR15]
MKRLLAVSAVYAALLTSNAFADCGISAGSVNILANDFKSIRTVVSTAEECASADVKITKNHNKQFADLMVAALTASPAKYSVVVVANGSISPLLSADLVRPLDDLVAKYGQQLKPNQLIKIGGKTMAIAFMANAQHFFYRESVLKEAGVEVPKTYEEVLAAAKTIHDKGIMKQPLAMSFLPDWDIAEEFLDLYYGGLGGTLFEEGSARPAIDMAKATQTLNLMKEMVPYIGPDYLTYDSDVFRPKWNAGQVAMMNMWGSSAAQVLPGQSPTPEIAKDTRLAAAPTFGGGATPATMVWWDGFTIAKNISDADAEASFRAMLHGISPEMVKKHPTDSVWLIEGYKPTDNAEGIVASIKGGAPGYPAVPYMDLLHNALGVEIGKFIQGKESAEQAISDAQKAYTTAASSAGFIN